LEFAFSSGEVGDEPPKPKRTSCSRPINRMPKVNLREKVGVVLRGHLVLMPHAR
jgi:hypothetical protein